MAKRVKIHAAIAVLFGSFLGLQGCVATQADEGDTQGSTEQGSVTNAENGLTTKLPCCPQGWDLYACPTSPGGPISLHCHNPKMECPSSCTNSGCDFAVSGVCPSTT